MNPAPSTSSTVVLWTLRTAGQSRTSAARTHALGCLVALILFAAIVQHRRLALALALCTASALDLLSGLLVFFARLDRLLEVSARGKLARGLGGFAHDARPR
jgi:hypothetical protein